MSAPGIHRLLGPTSFACAILLLSAPQQARAEDWPQWRGPGGQGTTAATHLPPNASSSSLRLRWKTEIPGEGCSSPVVCQGRVYLTTAYQGEVPHSADRAAS